MNAATLAGAAAVLLWSTLALLTAGAYAGYVAATRVATLDGRAAIGRQLVVEKGMQLVFRDWHVRFGHRRRTVLVLGTL